MNGIFIKRSLLRQCPNILIAFVCALFCAHAAATEPAVVEATQHGQAQTSLAAGACASTGPQRALVLGFAFRDEQPDPGDPVSAQQLLDDIDTVNFGRAESLTDYIDEVSYGRASWSGETHGWYVLDMDKPVDCSTDEIRNMVLAMASADADLTQFERLFFVNYDDDIGPNIFLGCAGQAITTCTSFDTPQGTITASWTHAPYFVNKPDRDDSHLGTIIHEGGHNLGLGHADARFYGSGSIIGPLGGGDLGIQSEYDDIFDAMGRTNRSHYNAVHKYNIGWLTDSEIHYINSNTACNNSDSTCEIEPISSPLRNGNALNKKAARVYRGIDPAGYTRTNFYPFIKEYFWIETRQPIGYDGYSGEKPAYSAAYGSAIVHHEHPKVVGYGWSSGRHTEILDMHPTGGSTTSEANDAPLLVGGTFTDPYTNIELSHQGNNGDNLVLGVYYPLSALDSDEDGLSYESEIAIGSNPTSDDTDGDGLTDLWEMCYDFDCASYNPAPSGGDLNMLSEDTDNDNIDDRFELSSGTDPLVSDAFPPAIAGFTPSSASPGQFIQITGEGFIGLSAVLFGGKPSTLINAVDGNTAVASVPDDGNTGLVTVETVYGIAVSTETFTVIAPPTIDAISPASGTVGQFVQILGANLLDIGSVTFGGVASTLIHETDGLSLVAQVPAGTPVGPVSVTVSNAHGTTVSAGEFTVIDGASPVISSFTPTSGTARTDVTITGTNLVGVISVQFNGIDASFTEVSGTTLTTRVPNKATTGRITVTTANGMATSSTDFVVEGGGGKPK